MGCGRRRLGHVTTRDACWWFTPMKLPIRWVSAAQRQRAASQRVGGRFRRKPHRCWPPASHTRLRAASSVKMDIAHARAFFWMPRRSQRPASTTACRARPGRVPAPFVPPRPGPAGVVGAAQGPATASARSTPRVPEPGFWKGAPAVWLVVLEAAVTISRSRSGWAARAHSERERGRSARTVSDGASMLGTGDVRRTPSQRSASDHGDESGRGKFLEHVRSHVFGWGTERGKNQRTLISIALTQKVCRVLYVTQPPRAATFTPLGCKGGLGLQGAALRRRPCNVHVWL